MKLKLTAIILTKNEEKNIVDCLQSLDFCDEKILVDDESEDRTAEIAEKLGAKVFKNPLRDDFANQRNFGMEKTEGEWILFVDPDEKVSKKLAEEIKEKISGVEGTNILGFYIKREDFMWGKQLNFGEVGNIKLLRLIKRQSGRWEGKVHERFKIKGRTVELQNPLFHYPHQSLNEFLKEINYYTSIRAEELYSKGIKSYWWSISLYPKAKFFLNYFLRRGFKDGIPGLIYAALMSFHSFLVRGKLWLLWQKK